MEGKDEALMCEGKICANKWMHQYSAGVPNAHYQLLEKSPEPLYYYFCAQQKKIATVKEMKSVITAFTAEIVKIWQYYYIPRKKMQLH